MNSPFATIALLLALLSLAGASALAAEDKRRGGSPLYGAIAYHADTKSTGWATDRRTSREARLEALKQCGHEQCVVLGTVTRGCIALAHGGRKPSLQKGVTRQEAETKALSRCGAGCEIAAWTCTR